MSKKSNLLVTIAAVVIIGGISFAGVIHHIHQKNQLLSSEMPEIKIDGTVLPNTRLIRDFNFVDNHDQPFNKTNLKNHWTLMFFGFTNCGYVCPTTLAELNKTYTDLKSRLPENLLPQIVMVSVDPERDTTARLGDYLKSFNTNFRGIRANLAETTALANQMSVVFAKVKMPNGDYTMNHSAEIMMLDPEGNLRAFFSYPHKADQMVHDYMAVVNAYPMK